MAVVQVTNQIDLEYSAGTLKTVCDLRLDPSPQAILKFCHASILNYRARASYEPQTKR